MKKLIFNFLGLITVGLVLISCNKDSDRDSVYNPQNYLNVAGKNYEISKGSFELIGSASNYDDYIIEIRLASKGVDIFQDEITNNQNFSGSGLMILFTTSSSMDSELDNYYSYSQTDHVYLGTFLGSYGLNFDFNNLSGETSEIIDGNITIEKNDTEYEIEINCTNDNNEKVTGFYKGSLDYYVMNEK